MRIAFTSRVAFVLILSLVSLARAGETFRVGAAISLRESLQMIAADYEKKTGDHVDLTFASSGQVLAQIKNGAPIDIFISAANEQVEALAKDDAIVDGSRTVIAANELVLVVPADRAMPKLGPSFESLGSDAIKRLAIGEPRTVPAGKYGMQVLEHLKLAEKLKELLIYGTNVRQVLTYVEQNEVTAGIVYASDAKESGDKVRIVATAPPDSHEPIVYPAVILKKSTHQDAAKRFIDYCISNDGRAVLIVHGFRMPSDKHPEPPPTSQPHDDSQHERR